jgi:hypothetical protein
VTLAPFEPCPLCDIPDTCGRRAQCDLRAAPGSLTPPRARLLRDAEYEMDNQAILSIAAGGRKDDAAKAPMHLIAPELLWALSDVLAFGAGKYAPRNWEAGLDWSRVYSAAQRHLWAWWGGEDRDPETGLCHLDHAACCLMFLIAYERRQAGRDDRPALGAEVQP